MLNFDEWFEQLTKEELDDIKLVQGIIKDIEYNGENQGENKIVISKKYLQNILEAHLFEK